MEEHVAKELVKTWFEANFKVLDKSPSSSSISQANNQDEQELVITKGHFLKHEINPFLISLGFEEWNPRSKLYKDWFLRDYLHQSEVQMRQARPWVLARKVSQSGLLQRLEAYCDGLRNDQLE